MLVTLIFEEYNAAIFIRFRGFFGITNSSQSIVDDSVNVN